MKETIATIEYDNGDKKQVVGKSETECLQEARRKGYLSQSKGEKNIYFS